MSPVYTHAAAALIAGALAGTACWTINGWRLGTQLEAKQAELNQARSQSAVTADALNRCNLGTDALAAAGKTMTAATADLVKAARQQSATHAGELADIKAALERATPTRQDGQKADCGDAWREIEGMAAK